MTIDLLQSIAIIAVAVGFVAHSLAMMRSNRDRIERQAGAAIKARRDAAIALDAIKALEGLEYDEAGNVTVPIAGSETKDGRTRVLRREPEVTVYSNGITDRHLGGYEKFPKRLPADQQIQRWMRAQFEAQRNYLTALGDQQSDFFQAVAERLSGATTVNTSQSTARGHDAPLAIRVIAADGAVLAEVLFDADTDKDGSSA